MLSLYQLMTQTPNAVRARAASQCSGTLTVKDQSFADRLRGRKGTQFRELRWGVSCSTGIRQCVVRFYSGGKVEKSSIVWVTCSCPYWCYYCEVAVSATGSSAVMISDGSAPKIRNPAMRPYLCKHLYKIATDGVKALKETGAPESFFYEEVGPRQRNRDLLNDRQETYAPPEDPRKIPWAGTPGYRAPEELAARQASRIDWSKPTLVNVPPGLRDRLGGGKR